MNSETFVKDFREKVKKAQTIEELLNAPEITGKEPILKKGRMIVWNQFVACENIMTNWWLVSNLFLSPSEDWFMKYGEVKKELKSFKTNPVNIKRLTAYFNQLHNKKDK